MCAGPADAPELLAIDDIRETLVEVRDKASHQGYGLLAHLINEAFEEVEKIRAIIKYELRKAKRDARKRDRGIKD